VTDERRASDRVNASLPGQIETEQGKQSIAITRDVSAGGLLLFSRRSHAVGEAVRLTLVLRGQEHHVTGRVLRQEMLAPGESTLWRTKVAISVDDPAMMEQLLSVLSAA
jgi:hypothetical protein